MKKSKLPKIDSIKKLAQFWDTHDLTDFEDQLEEVAKPVFARSRATPGMNQKAQRRRAIRVPLKAHEAEVVQRMARSNGVSTQQLVRTWVVQKITGRSNGRRVSSQ